MPVTMAFRPGPRQEGDIVHPPSKGTYSRRIPHIEGQLVRRACLPLNEWPASANNAAEFI